MKKAWIVTLAVLAVILLVFGFCIYRLFRQNMAVITAKPVVVGETYISPANIKQPNSVVQIGVCGGTLFIVPGKGSGIPGTKYQSCLCAFEDGSLVKRMDLRRKGLSAELLHGGCAYFSSEHSPLVLYGCSLKSGELRELYSLKDLPDPQYRAFTGNRFQTEDGALCFPVLRFSEPEQWCVRVAEDRAASCEAVTEHYLLGDRLYYLTSENNLDKIYCIDAEGQESELPLEDARNRSLIRTDHGLLIHNRSSYGRGVMLYYVTEAGELIELFAAPQLSSVSAVTVYHDTVYFSFMRTEKYGSIGELGFENDELIGTWRISLADYSAEKLSDRIYDGMYIFDDTGIYACDCYCDIYKLDFDGNIMDTLMEVKR